MVEEGVQVKSEYFGDDNTANHKQAGPFKFGRLLGRGITGSVRVGVHVETGFQVALKIVKKKYLQQRPERWKVFRREMAVMKMIEHPHIVKLYDVFETTDKIFLVTEFVKGGELFEYIPQNGLQRQDALRILAQVTMALLHCHEYGIVHRDLKPENILLDDRQNVKLADFGMARLTRKGSTLTTSCGSPHYASPEVLRGAYDGTISDVWSLGAIFYAISTGCMPFHAESIPTMFSLILAGRYEVPPEVPEDMKNLICQMLEVDVKKRIRLEDIPNDRVFRGTKFFPSSFKKSFSVDSNLRASSLSSLSSLSSSTGSFTSTTTSPSSLSSPSTTSTSRSFSFSSGAYLMPSTHSPPSSTSSSPAMLPSRLSELIDENILDDVCSLGWDNKEEVRTAVLSDTPSLEKGLYNHLLLRKRQRYEELTRLSPKKQSRSIRNSFSSTPGSSGPNTPTLRTPRSLDRSLESRGTGDSPEFAVFTLPPTGVQEDLVVPLAPPSPLSLRTFRLPPDRLEAIRERQNQALDRIRSLSPTPKLEVTSPIRVSHPLSPPVSSSRPLSPPSSFQIGDRSPSGSISPSSSSSTSPRFGRHTSLPASPSPVGQFRRLDVKSSLGRSQDGRTTIDVVAEEKEKLSSSETLEKKRPFPLSARHVLKTKPTADDGSPRSPSPSSPRSPPSSSLSSVSSTSSSSSPTIVRWFSRFFNRRPSLDPFGKTSPVQPKKLDAKPASPSKTAFKFRTLVLGETSRQRSNSLPEKKEVSVPKSPTNRGSQIQTKPKQKSLLREAQENVRKQQIASQSSPSFQPAIIPSLKSTRQGSIVSPTHQTGGGVNIINHNNYTNNGDPYGDVDIGSSPITSMTLTPPTITTTAITTTTITTTPISPRNLTGTVSSITPTATTTTITLSNPTVLITIPDTHASSSTIPSGPISKGNKDTGPEEIQHHQDHG